MIEYIKKGKLRILILLISAVVLIWLASVAFIISVFDNWSDRGTFGDMFGAVNSLFSGLAFVGLIYAVILQKQDLELQKNEIELNRAELKKSAKAQQSSQKALKEQVEQMKITARLNALNTIINFYNIQIANNDTPLEVVQKVKSKRKDAIKEIDQLIDRISDDEIDI